MPDPDAGQFSIERMIRGPWQDLRPGDPGWTGSIYTRAQPPPPPKPAGPPLFLIDAVNNPDWTHPLFRDFDNVAIGACVDCRFLYTQEGKHQFWRASGPADTTYGNMTVLARLMDGHARYSVRRAFKWFSVPAGFGAERFKGEMKTYPNAQSLLGHPVDALRSGRRGPFFAYGARVNRVWATEFLEHLAGELKFRRLPDPLAFMLCSEFGVGDDYAGHWGAPDTGWVPEALADPRAGDPAHTIDGSRTFAQYMEMSRTLDGKPVPEYDDRVPLGLPPGRAQQNDESSERYRGAMRLAWDWSREIAFGSVARRVFLRDPTQPHKNVKIGEYQAACDSPWSPVRVRPLTFLHQMCGVFHSDIQCPDWYGGIIGYRPQPLFDSEPGWETLNNWLRIHPNEEKDPNRRMNRVGLEVAKGMAIAHAKAAPGCPLAPYVYHGYGAPEDDMVEYLRACREHGAWAVNVFMPEANKAAHDYWARVLPRVCA